jgi:hypothetical protein
VIGADARLPERIDRLERFAVAATALAALVPLIVGWFLPWYVESRDDDEMTVRLATTGFGLFAPQPENASLDAGGVVFALSLLFLDLVTAVAVVVVIQVMARTWRRVRFSNAVAALFIVCLLGAVLTSVVATGSENTDLHPSSVVVYGIGVVLVSMLLLSGVLRAWWLPEE